MQTERRRPLVPVRSRPNVISMGKRGREAFQMSTPLNIAVDIDRLIVDAKDRQASLDVWACVNDLYLRFLNSGCSREQIAEALAGEADAAGLTNH